jgi:hypothetical protein
VSEDLIISFLLNEAFLEQCNKYNVSLLSTSSWEVKISNIVALYPLPLPSTHTPESLDKQGKDKVKFASISLKEHNYLCTI